MWKESEKVGAKKGPIRCSVSRVAGTLECRRRVGEGSSKREEGGTGMDDLLMIHMRLVGRSFPAGQKRGKIWERGERVYSSRGGRHRKKCQNFWKTSWRLIGGSSEVLSDRT